MKNSLIRICLLAVTATALLGPSLVAQKKRSKKIPKWRIDPYTKNDPELMKKAGIVRFHPMTFGELAGKAVSTEVIEEEIGKAKILWIETEHFRIGTSLPAYPIPASDRKVKKKIQDELERLAKKLPKVNVKTRKLNRWLRAHLFAQRCEEVYAEFMKKLSVTKASFPTAPKTLMNNKYYGEGPFLGQPDKYLVLMLEKQSDFTRYLTLFIGRQQGFAQRWNFKNTGSLIIATSSELEEGRLKHDTSMHCHIVWNVVHNMISGYRFYSYDLPVWFTEGNAHWWAKQVDEDRALDFDQNESARAKMLNTGKWKPKARQWLTHKKSKPFSELLSLRDYGQLTKYDHVKCWSLVDWMINAEGPEKYAAFMNSVKGYTDPVTGLATAKEVLNLQRKGLRSVYSVSPLQLEEKWRKWVLKTYPAK